MTAIGRCPVLLLPAPAVAADSRWRTAGFGNCATGHDQRFRRRGQAAASYWLIRPPSTGVRLIRCAGNRMTLG